MKHVFLQTKVKYLETRVLVFTCWGWGGYGVRMVLNLGMGRGGGRMGSGMHMVLNWVGGGWV